MKFESKQHALAYLMGVYLSDGTLYLKTGSLRVAVKDEEFRDEVAAALAMLDARFGRGRTTEGLYWVNELKPYRIGRWLEGIFLHGKDHLPSVPDDLAQDLVAGIMDGDGCISFDNSYFKSDPQTDKGYWRIGIYGRCGYLKDLQRLFAAHGVTMYGPTSEYSNNINLRSFVAAGFYFRLPRKQRRLQRYQEGIR